MKKVLVSAIVAAVVYCSSTAAQAASFPTTLTIDTSSSLKLSLIFLIPPPVEVDFNFTGGAWETEIEQSGTEPPVVSMTSNGGEFTIENLSVEQDILFGAGKVTLITNNIVAAIKVGGPFPNISLTNPGTIDLEGLEIGFIGGSLDLVVVSPSINIEESLDLEEDPLWVEAPEGSTATINETGGPTQYEVTLSIPISVTSIIEAAPGVNLPLTLAGVLSFTGIKLIPEPGSIALFGIGALGIALPALRRYRRKK